MSLSFFTDLFVLEGVDGASPLAFLPYMILAVVIGVILAALYFTVWRSIEAKLARRLHEAGATSAQDAKTLAELGYRPGFWERVLRFLLRSHACMVYKNLSSDERDAQHLEYMKQEGEVSDPDVTTESATDGAVNTADGVSAEAPAEEAPLTETVAPDTKQSRKKRLRPRSRMKVPPETRFYIVPTRIEYVETRVLTFSPDDFWGLGFTIAAAFLIGLGVLALLDPLVGLLMK